MNLSRTRWLFLAALAHSTACVLEWDSIDDRHRDASVINDRETSGMDADRTDGTADEARVTSDVGIGEAATVDIGLVCIDMDNDGYPAAECGGLPVDCDDRNMAVHPMASEVCDRMDLDEDCNPCTVAGATDGDGDMDTFLSATCANVFRGATPMCPRNVQVRGGRVFGTDCEDGDANIRPNQTEACNQRDDNCNDMVDEDIASRSSWPDLDRDGEGDAHASAIMACQIPVGFVDNMRDCNDADPNVRTTASEICDGVDQNCNGSIDEGVTVTGSCPTGLPSRCAAGQNYCGGSRSTSTEGYIQDWLVLGPIAAVFPTGTFLDTRDLLGGETTAAPTPGSMTARLTWTPWRSGVGPTGALTSCNGIDLARLFAPSGATTAENFTSYVFTNVYSPSDRMAELALSCDDGCRAWINGDQVANSTTSGGCITDAIRGAVRLRAGLNRLLVKVSNGPRNALVSARLRWPGANAAMRDLTFGLDASSRAVQCGQTGMPIAETCNQVDDNCDGTSDEGCPCAIGAMRPCYTGRVGSEGRGVCHGGTQTCGPTISGSAEWGRCVGEITPTTELCSPADEDCDGNPYNGLPAPRTGRDCSCAWIFSLQGRQYANDACTYEACTYPTSSLPAPPSSPAANATITISGNSILLSHDWGSACGTSNSEWCYNGISSMTREYRLQYGSVMRVPRGRYAVRVTFRTLGIFPPWLAIRIRDSNGSRLGPALDFQGSPNSGNYVDISPIDVVSDCSVIDPQVVIPVTNVPTPEFLSIVSTQIVKLP